MVLCWYNLCLWKNFYTFSSFSSFWRCDLCCPVMLLGMDFIKSYLIIHPQLGDAQKFLQMTLEVFVMRTHILIDREFYEIIYQAGFILVQRVRHRILREIWRHKEVMGWHILGITPQELDIIFVRLVWYHEMLFLCGVKNGMAPNLGPRVFRITMGGQIIRILW